MDDCSSKPIWQVMLELIGKCKNASELDLAAHLILHQRIKRNNQEILDAFKRRSMELGYDPQAVIRCLEKRLQILNSEYSKKCREWMFHPIEDLDMTVRLFQELKVKNLLNLDQVWRESDRWSDKGRKLRLKEENLCELEHLLSKAGVIKS